MRIGPYEVIGELGRGGMGTVFHVRTPDGRDAALKRLHRADPESFARFEREQRLQRALGEAEGFVGLLDATSAPEGAWLLMPFVPGGTLRARLARGPLGVEETVALGVELARALGRAHARGIVHRDVKPENVLFTASGRPLLADLGLAKHFDRDARGASQSVTLTRDGAFKGTAAYMAPEQIEGAARAGSAADVFALGVVLHECLSGLPAFRGESVLEVLTRLGSGRPEPIGRSDVPAWRERVIARALERDPGDRFADGATLARALAARGKQGSPRRVALGLGLLAGGAALAAGIAWMKTSSSTARRLVEAARGEVGAGQLDAAFADLSRAIELDPTLAIAWAERAAVRHERDDYDGELADATRAIELDPRIARAWLERGTARGKKGDWAGDAADQTRAIELDPGLAEAWMRRGWALSRTGGGDRALAELTRAVELGPGLAATWATRGGLRAERGDLEGAIADCTKAIELAPGRAQCWVNRSSARGQTGDLDGAISDATRAIELAPKLASAWHDRAGAYAKKGNYDAAIADGTRAIELDPRIAAAWLDRGIARGNKEDWEGMRADLTRAVELDPGLAWAWANRGVARLNLGDPGGMDDLLRARDIGGRMTPQILELIERAKQLTR